MAVGDTKLPITRAAIGEYLSGKLGKNNQNMTDALWATATTEYGNVSTSLGKVIK